MDLANALFFKELANEKSFIFNKVSWINTKKGWNSYMIKIQTTGIINLMIFSSGQTLLRIVLHHQDQGIFLKNY